MTDLNLNPHAAAAAISLEGRSALTISSLFLAQCAARFHAQFVTKAEVHSFIRIFFGQNVGLANRSLDA